MIYCLFVVRQIIRNPKPYAILGAYAFNSGKHIGMILTFPFSSKFHFLKTFLILAQQWVRYIVLPVAMVVGGIGVYAEGKLMPKKKSLPYLEHSRVEERINRLLEEDMSPETKSLAEEKSRMVPKSSLLVNQAGKRVYPAQS
jgi:hypothetical protein